MLDVGGDVGGDCGFVGVDYGVGKFVGVCDYGDVVVCKVVELG